MKRLLIHAVALAVSVAFSACTSASSATTPTPATSKSLSEVPSSTAYTSSSQLPQSDALTRFSVNKELLQLIGASNKELQEYTNGECYVQDMSMGAKEISFYEPYFNVIFSPQGNAKIKDYYKDGYEENLYKYNENPLNDDFKVMWISLTADIKGDDIIQDSLRLLFNTNEDITYDLLCKQLNQEPELTFFSDVYYYCPATPENDVVGNKQIPTIKKDYTMYDSSFELEELTADITFLKQVEKYMATHVRVKNKTLTEKELQPW